MLLLLSHHIVDLYIWVEQLLPQQYQGPERPSLLSNSEVVTVLIWNAVMMRQNTLTDIHQHLRLDLVGEFPHTPKYSAFVAHCHRLLPVMFQLLEMLLSQEEPLRIIDSTMVEVCKLYRSDRHRVARNVAHSSIRQKPPRVTRAHAHHCLPILFDKTCFEHILVQDV